MNGPTSASCTQVSVTRILDEISAWIPPPEISPALQGLSLLGTSLTTDGKAEAETSLATLCVPSCHGRSRHQANNTSAPGISRHPLDKTDAAANGATSVPTVGESRVAFTCGRYPACVLSTAYSVGDRECDFTARAKFTYQTSPHASPAPVAVRATRPAEHVPRLPKTQ